ncbi:MAG TPA: hypothetical protein VFT43_04385, partial [Candidatus Polarisedimenticolia bacterium]|nr:hypothetical protein [Candidatus Polarisedimenticolia bacterium]
MSATSGDPDLGKQDGETVRDPLPPPATGPVRAGYRIRLVYTEPEFQRRNPQCPPEFAITYLGIPARSERQAVDLVLEEWRRCSRHSRVAWFREIKS